MITFFVCYDRLDYTLQIYYKKASHLFKCEAFAEAARFELAVRLPVRQFSKLLVSATHPNFLECAFFGCGCKDRMFFLIKKIFRKIFMKKIVLLRSEFDNKNN